MTSLLLNLSMLGDRPTGLGVYAQHCAFALAERFDAEAVANMGYHSPVRVAFEAPAGVALGQGRMAAVRRLLWARSVRTSSNTLVYSPTHHSLPSAARQVLTVHDLICLRFPAQHRPQYLFFRFVLPRLLRRCEAVFTVSETTRQDVAETYKFPLDKIFVVPNGVDAEAFRRAGSPAAARESTPYLLMVGARYPHKNVQEVLSRHECWASRYRLVVASCGGVYRDVLQAQAERLGIAHRVEFLPYVTQDELVTLYRDSKALVYPSLWEGFGIPPLEALASGTQVIASDIPAHREVLGGAAAFVKPGDAASWVAAFQSLHRHDDCVMREREGEALLRKLTWTRSADLLEAALLTVDPTLAGQKR